MKAEENGAIDAVAIHWLQSLKRKRKKKSSSTTTIYFGSLIVKIWNGGRRTIQYEPEAYRRSKRRIIHIVYLLWHS